MTDLREQIEELSLETQRVLETQYGHLRAIDRCRDQLVSLQLKIIKLDQELRDANL